MTRLHLDQEVLDLPACTEPWSEKARQWACAMVSEPSSHFAENVSARFGLLQWREELIPIVIPDQPLPASAVRPQAGNVSCVSHYSHYTQEEMLKRGSALPARLLGFMFLLFQSLLHLNKTDKVVQVNNWLLTTNPSRKYDKIQVDDIIDCLKKAFPRRAIVFRGIIFEHQVTDQQAFGGPGFARLRYRQVWISADSQAAMVSSRDIKRDQKLLADSGYELLTGSSKLEANIDRVCELYRQLYLERHSELNLHYTPEFLRLMARTGVMDFWLLKKDGKVNAFKSTIIQEQLMTGSLVGYDLSRPRKEGLYRQAIAVQVGVAAKLGLPLHMSSGVGSFKALRGGQPFDEYEMVFVQHLAPPRRWVWRFLDRLTALGAASDSQDN